MFRKIAKISMQYCNKYLENEIYLPYCNIKTSKSNSTILQRLNLFFSIVKNG